MDKMCRSLYKTLEGIAGAIVRADIQGISIRDAPLNMTIAGQTCTTVVEAAYALNALYQDGNVSGGVRP